MGHTPLRLKSPSHWHASGWTLPRKGEEAIVTSYSCTLIGGFYACVFRESEKAKWAFRVGGLDPSAARFSSLDDALIACEQEMRSVIRAAEASLCGPSQETFHEGLSFDRQ